jgi:hypothetical protein
MKLQDCGYNDAWPYAKIVKQAANLEPKPDLVIYVGTITTVMTSARRRAIVTALEERGTTYGGLIFSNPHNLSLRGRRG